jgi:hypothetical protein
LGNGDIDMRFPATPGDKMPYYNVKGWVLSWGADIKVIGPEGLKKAVCEEIKKMAKSLPGKKNYN